MVAGHRESLAQPLAVLDCYIVIQILMGDCWNLGLAH